ncbi:DUF3558 domain-containing protein [Saccharopolyspora taberi]|uniref:DUF3558 domain-containing protein n=1 Tax=Saccharopolyspora taberi TaxID=60895 RepID=A0ABN3VM23_9PSEU
MLRRPVLVTLSLAAALSLSACAQGGSGSTTPPGTGDSAPTSESNAADPALKVEAPLNLKAVSDGCQLLTDGQLAQLGGGGAPTPFDTEWGQKGCTWTNDAVVIEVAPDSKQGGGFSRIQRNKNSFLTYAETKVANYPAARVNQAELLCGVAAGVSDEDTVLVSVTRYNSDAPQHADPCAFAEKVFTEVIKNIPPQS